MASASSREVVTAPTATGARPQDVCPVRTADSPKYCFLSLDGGGVRGLSTLYILKKLMRGLNDDRREVGLPRVQPCDIFDLIAGTSTGGLIAIMLGRLKMSVDECIEAYITLMQDVFSKKENISLFGFMGGVKSRFSSAALKQAIEKVLSDRGVPLQEKFEEDVQPTCKVFVCATFQKMGVVTRLRSYDIRGGNDFQPTIVEAALATSAAPTYFSDITIGGSTFIDGAIGANNPAEQLEQEAKKIFCEGRNDLHQKVACFLSLGTGHMDPTSVSDRGVKHLVKALKKQATETNDTHVGMLSRWQDRDDDCRYYRFNVEHGLAKVTLAEFEKRDTIQSGTFAYLGTPEISTRLLQCSRHLRSRQLPSSHHKSQETLRIETNELIDRGNAKRKLPARQVNYRVLMEALSFFKRALELLTKDPQATPKERVRLYQKLAETSTDCSIRAPNAKEQKKHIKEAENHGQASLKAAKESRNNRMVAQVEFLLACVAVWNLCLQANRTEDEVDKLRGDLERCFDLLQREPSLNIEGFKLRREVFLGYLV